MRRILVMALTAAFLFPIGAQAEVTKDGLTPPRHGLGFSIRAGGSFPTSDILDHNDSEPGPALNVQFYYSFKRILNVGIMAEYDKHRVEDSRFGKTGEFETFSLMPFVEGHVTLGRFSPYASIGLGINVNELEESSGLNSFCGSIGGCKVEPDPTVAFRIAGGTDIFLNDHVALNLEVAWKSNKGDAEFEVNGTKVFENKFTAHTFLALAGVKFYFPSSR